MRRLAPWRTVRGRLVAAALLVELVMLGMLVGNSQRLLREAMGGQAERQAEQITPVLVAALVAPLAQYDYATVQAVLNESQAIRGIDYLAVTDLHGQRVAQSGWAADRPLPTPDGSLDLEQSPPRFDVVRPIGLAGQQLGTLHFGLDLSRIVEARQQLLQQGLVIAGGELLLSAGLLSLLGRLITRQLTRLTEASQRVAEGRFDLDPVPEGSDEVGRMGSAFNAMSRAIGERVEQLTRANEQTVQMAASLHERNLQLDAVFQLSPDGFVSFDEHGVARFASPAFCRLTGVPEHTVVGNDEARLSACLVRLARPDSSFTSLAALREAPPGRDGQPAVHRLVLQGKRERVLELSLRESGARDVARILFLRDVTHEHEVDRMKSEFLSHAAHELRTPMASIFGFTELLRVRQMSEERRQEMLAIIHRQAGAMTEIIDELLDLARIDDRRGQDFVFSAVDPVELVQEVVAGFKPPGERSGPTLVMPAQLPALRADRAKLAQAVRNLLSNAYKYSPGGGEVQVQLLGSADGQRVGLRVSDQGIGMTPEQLSHVFDRFYRADSSGSIPGTGLGMSIVKELMALHGGDVEVDSQPGLGTVATLWLPVMPPAAVDIPLVD